MPETEPKPPIQVKMKIGDIEFEIQCQEEQLQAAVDKILSTVTKRLEGTKLMTERVASPTRAQTCKEVIRKLWEEGWFATRKNLGQVHGEMARRGFHYDRTAVAHALIDLVKEGILTRQGKLRRYMYTQKRPP